MISVLITTYDDSLYLNDSINSILDQTYSKLELLIIDDGSTDNTEKIVNSFKDDRIKYYKINHVGRSKALNFGLSKCRYDWVAIQDADDLALNSRIETQVKEIKDNNDVVFSSILFFHQSRIIFPLFTPRFFNNKMMRVHSQIINGSVCFNRNFILENGGYDEKLDSAEDYDLFLRLGDKVNYKLINEILVLCRWSDVSLSRRNFMRARANTYRIQSKYFDYDNYSLKSSYDATEFMRNGWREFFYGNKSRAREIWLSEKSIIKDKRIITALFLTFLPNRIFLLILKYDWIPRFKYFLTSRKVKKLHKQILTTTFTNLQKSDKSE